MDRKLYKETFDEIRLPQKTRDALASLPERSIHMKHFAVKKSVLVFAAVLVLCLGCTCYAALRAVRTDSSPAPATLTHSYEAVEQAQKETGLSFRCPETLDYGFSFGALNINEDTDYDENGEAAGTYKSIYISYLNDKAALIYQISPLEEAASQEALAEAGQTAIQTDTCQDKSGQTVTLYYLEESLEEDGSSSEQESVIWSDGTNFYSLSGYDTNLSADEWFTLAEDLL